METLFYKKTSGFDDAKGVTLVYQKSGSQTVVKIRLGVDRLNIGLILKQKKPYKARESFESRRSRRKSTRCMKR